MRLRPIASLGVVLVLTAGPASTAGRAARQSVPAQERAATLSLTVSPPRLTPGGVALVTVSSTHDLTGVTADVMGRAVPLWRAESPREWLGLVGVRLDTTPGPYPIKVDGSATDGRGAAARGSLLVERRQFLTRRLTVDSRLAQPPKEEAARIAEETRIMAETFAVLTPDRLWRGPWTTPVPGMATSSFGRLTITNGAPAGRHQGADFRAATGTPVRAPNRGRVAVAQDLYFAGNTVILDHGLGVFSLLAHLSAIDVRVGDIVAQGSVVGRSGATGRVTGPHLHWAVRFGDSSVDPLSLIAALARLPEGTTSPRPGT